MDKNELDEWSNISRWWKDSIDIEFYISDNYTGDVTTTNWTLVNSDMESEINNNGMVFSGRPYPGDQSGPDPDNERYQQECK